MKLHGLNTAVVLFAHHRIGKAFGGKGLSHTRSTFENNILFVAEEGDYAFVFLSGNIDLREEIGGGKDDIILVAEKEGLTAHANAIKVRFEEN